MKKGVAFIITAPSGAGKTTLINKLLKDFPQITFSVSYTTRDPRPGEIHGKDYFFVTPQEFKELINKDFFAEWAVVHGNYYGTPSSSVVDALSKGIDVLFDIDIKGAFQLKKNIKESVSVFILPPSREELELRLKKRGKDTEDEIKIRLKRAKEEILAAYDFDFLVLNDDLNRAYQELKSIYLSEKCRTTRAKGLLQGILNRWRED